MVSFLKTVTHLVCPLLSVSNKEVPHLRHLFAVFKMKTEFRPADDPEGKRTCTVPEHTEKETVFAASDHFFSQVVGRQVSRSG